MCTNIHSIEVHVDPRITFDELFELLQARYEFRRIVPGIFDLLAYPSLVDAVVSGKPCARSLDKVLIWDVMLVSMLVNHFNECLVQ